MRFPEGRTFYFDTSTWNRLARLDDPEKAVADLHDSGSVVLGSLFTAVELAKTNDGPKRVTLCRLMRSLHGDGPLLEHPMLLASASARPTLDGEREFGLSSLQQTEELLAFLEKPADETLRQEFITRAGQLEQKYEGFLSGLRGKLDPAAPFLSKEAVEISYPDILTRFEPAVSVEEMRALCAKDSLWRAVAAMFGYTLHMAANNTPIQVRTSEGKKGDRPDAFDMWQLVYLGLPIEAFVTDDGPLRDAADAVSKLLKTPKRVLSSEQFF